MSTANYVFGSGKVYVDVFDANGAATGERYVGSVAGFELSPGVATIDHMNTESGQHVVDKQVITAHNPSVALRLDNVDDDNYLLFVQGTKTALSQSNAAVTNEQILIATKDRYYQLGKTAALPFGNQNVSAVVITGSGGSPTYTVGTDYTVDLTLGRLYIPAGSTIAGGTTIKAAYSKATATGTQVGGATQTTPLQGALRFVADNQSGTNRDFYAPVVNFTGNGTAAFKSDNAWSGLAVDCRIMKPSSGDLYTIGGRLA